MKKIKWKNVLILGLSVLMGATIITISRYKTNQIRTLQEELETAKIERSEEYRNYLEAEYQVEQMKLIIEHQERTIEEYEERLGIE